MNVVFEALAGKPAFEGQHAMALLAKLVFEEAPRLEAHCPDAPPALAALIARMLAKDPAARPADGEALSAELAAFSTLGALRGRAGGLSARDDATPAWATAGARS